MSLIGDIVKVGSFGLIDPEGDAGDAATAQRDAATLANQATLEATEKNIDFQKWLWGEQKALAQPYADMGARAISPYEQEVSKGFTLDDFYADPGYQFGLNEGTRARENAAASRGMQLSGPQLKAMQRFGTDYASTKYNEAFNRRQIGLDNLYRMILSGQSAAAGQAQSGTPMGAQVSSSILAGGQSTAQMYKDIGDVNAAQAMMPWNTLMDIGGLGASFAGSYYGSR